MHYVGSENTRLQKKVMIFISVALQPNSGLGSLVLDVAGSSAVRHTASSTLLKEWLDLGRGANYTKQTQETSIHICSGIRTRDPSNRAPADLRLRPHGYRNRLMTL